MGGILEFRTFTNRPVSCLTKRPVVQWGIRPLTKQRSNLTYAERWAGRIVANMSIFVWPTGLLVLRPQTHPTNTVQVTKLGIFNIRWGVGRDGAQDVLCRLLSDSHCDVQ
jgi:hypothetical protein